MISKLNDGCNQQYFSRNRAQTSMNRDFDLMLILVFRDYVLKMLFLCKMRVSMCNIEVGGLLKQS